VAGAVGAVPVTATTAPVAVDESRRWAAHVLHTARMYARGHDAAVHARGALGTACGMTLDMGGLDHAREYARGVVLLDTVVRRARALRDARILGARP